MTIDHQQATIRAIADALHGDACPADPDTGESCGCGSYEREAEIALTAAAPHLRAGIAEEVRNLRSQFHDDAKTAFGRIGSSTEAYLNALDDVLALLEGGGGCCERPKCPGGSLCCCQMCEVP